MKQTWGLKILNTSKAKINLFFPLYFNAPSLTYFKAFEKNNQTTKYAQCVHFITWEEEEEGFVHIGGQHLAVPDVSLFLLCFEQPKFFFLTSCSCIYTRV